MLSERLYVLFLVLAAIFGGMSLQDYLKNAQKLTPAAKVRMKMAIIFLVIGGYLLVQSMSG